MKNSKVKVLILNDNVNHVANVMRSLCEILAYSPNRSAKTTWKINALPVGHGVAVAVENKKTAEKHAAALVNNGLTVRIEGKTSYGITK